MGLLIERIGQGFVIKSYRVQGQRLKTHARSVTELRQVVGHYYGDNGHGYPKTEGMMQACPLCRYEHPRKKTRESDGR